MKKNMLCATIIASISLSSVVWGATEVKPLLKDTPKAVTSVPKAVTSVPKAVTSVPKAVERDWLVSSVDGVLTKDALLNLITAAKDSVKMDARKGFTTLMATKGTFSDHIELQNWGKFLYAYANKGVSSMPIGNITIGDTGIVLLGNKEGKDWVKLVLIPAVLDSIVSEGLSYSCNIYNFEPARNILLKDFEVDMLKNRKYFKTVDPFSGKVLKDKKVSSKVVDKSTLLVHSIGEDYGLSLSSKYAALMNEVKKDSGAYKGVVGDTKAENACISVIADVGTLKNIGSDVTLVNKELKDVMSYNGMVYNVITNKMMIADGTVGFSYREVLPVEETSEKEVKAYSPEVAVNGVKNKDLKATSESTEVAVRNDIPLDVSKCMLIKLKDGICVTPVVYTELFPFRGRLLPTNTTIDVSNFLQDGSSDLLLSDGSSYNIKDYIGDAGVLDTTVDKKGNAILNCPDSNLPYIRLAKWFVSSDSENLVTSLERKETLKKIKNICKTRGTISDYKVATSGYNAGYTMSLSLAGLGISILFGAVGVRELKKRKRNIVAEEVLFDVAEEVDADEGNEF